MLLSRSATGVAALGCLLSVLLVSACATAGGGGVGSDRNLLTEVDLAPWDNLTAYEVIDRLRPLWLQPRSGGVDVLSIQGADRPTRSGDARTTTDIQRNPGIQVYVDGALKTVGGGEDRARAALEEILAIEVREMRFLDASAASMRFGTGHSSGAILVSTKNR